VTVEVNVDIGIENIYFRGPGEGIGSPIEINSAELFLRRKGDSGRKKKEGR